MNPLTVFQPTFTRLKSDLPRLSFTRAYEAARPNHRILIPYAIPADVLAALASTSPLPITSRDVVLSALLEERRQSTHPVWQTLLLLTFEPMLRRLRARLGRTRSDDLDQRVFVAFLSALTIVRPGPFLAVAIKRTTESQLFAPLRAERRETQNALFDEETHPPDLLTLDTATRAAEVIRIIEAAGGAELRDAMLATRGTDETLGDYVARTHPHATPAERAAAYERLWRTRSTVERRLRETRRSENDANAAPAAGAA